MSISDTIIDVINLLKMKADIRKVNLFYEIGEKVPKIFFTDKKSFK
jgi:hypothetical protein